MISDDINDITFFNLQDKVSSEMAEFEVVSVFIGQLEIPDIDCLNVILN